MPVSNNRPPGDKAESESALERSIALEKLADRVYQLMREELRLDLARTQNIAPEGRL